MSKMPKGEIEKKSIDLPLSFANKIPDKFIQRENCKLCKAECREEVEKQYAETENLKSAYNVAQKYDKNIGYHAVRRHILNHFVAHERALALKEYVKTLNETVVSKKYSRRRQLVERVYMLQHRMAEMEAMTEGASLAEMAKTADAIKKLSDSITTHEKEIEVIDRKFEPVTILVNNLISIIDEEIKKRNDPKISECLASVYEKLTQSVQDTLIEKE